jgi:hypothetical protein
MPESKWDKPSELQPGAPTPDLIRRFNRHWRTSTEPPPPGLEKPCKIWTGAMGSRGYGIFKAPLTKSGLAKAHRVAYWIAIGRPPAGVQIDHLCRKRACVEPSHLELVGISEHARKSNADRWHEDRDEWEDIL